MQLLCNYAVRSTDPSNVGCSGFTTTRLPTLLLWLIFSRSRTELNCQPNHFIIRFESGLDCATKSINSMLLGNIATHSSCSVVVQMHYKPCALLSLVGIYPSLAIIAPLNSTFSPIQTRLVMAGVCRCPALKAYKLQIFIYILNLSRWIGNKF